jgi:GNAT superfamily N-acetyltransferase
MTSRVTNNPAEVGRNKDSGRSGDCDLGTVALRLSKRSTEQAEISATDVRLKLARLEDRAGINGAIELGNRSQATLGHLPFEAYDDAAARGCLLLAVDPDERVVAYALFGLGPRWVRLTHLTVAPELRKHGVARSLLDWISATHEHRAGILVWCRHDYGLAPMWSKLGFTRGAEKRGRGRRPTTLVSWWRDHGQPKLFQTAPQEVAVRASMDFNVVRDLADARRRDRTESLALLNDQFVDRLELLRTPMLDVEIDEVRDTPLRVECTNQASLLTTCRPDSAVADAVESELFIAVGSTNAGLVGSKQGQRDVRYIAEAIAAGLNVFVSRDLDLTNALRPAAAARGLQILRPAEVIVRLDELTRAEAYRPASVQSTAFSRRLLRAGEEGKLAVLVARHDGEREAEFRGRTRELTAAGFERLAILDPEGQIVGGVLKRIDDRVLDVELLRVAEGPFAATLVRQLLFALRTEAVASSSRLIRIRDPHMPQAITAALAEDGFVPSDGSYTAYVIDECGSAGAVSDAANKAAREANLVSPPRFGAGLPALTAAYIERAWWPAKVSDSLLPSYIIPIRQEFSRELLGVPLGLFARPPELGLSLEQVYYRSPRGPRVVAPARLLWYMSGSERRGVEAPAIVATSVLEEVIVGEPSDLHERFQHLGVWRLDQVRAASRDGLAQMLRFSRTFQFVRPVLAGDVRRLVGHLPQGPTKITSDVYERLYAAGRSRDE